MKIKDIIIACIFLIIIYVLTHAPNIKPLMSIDYQIDRSLE